MEDVGAARRRLKPYGDSLRGWERATGISRRTLHRKLHTYDLAEETQGRRGQ